MPANNGDGKGSDGTMLAMVAACAFAGLGYIIWHYKHAAISTAVMWFKTPEAWLLAQLSSAFQLDYDFVRYADPEAVTWAHLHALFSDTGMVFRWPVAFLLVGFSIWCFLKPLDRQFRRKLDLTGLMREQARVFPTILPAVVENPMLDKSGRWARPLKERGWAKARKVKCYDPEGRLDMEEGRPDREAAREAFVEDLGSYWRGARTLPPHLRALVAAFSLKAAQKRSDYQALVDSLAKLWAKAGYRRGMDKALAENGKVLEYVDIVLANTGFGGAADSVGYGHAYVASAMPEILEWGRRGGGVIGCADFTWLRVENRTIWYVLQNTGRETSYPEGAAGIAHWRAEKVAGRPLFEPAVDQAVVGLLEGMGYDPWGYDEDEGLPVLADGG